MDKNSTGPQPPSSVPSHLVVALPHLDLVSQLLDRICPGRFERIAEDKRLGLALVDVRDLPQVAAELANEPIPARVSATTPIDRLLGVLRAQCADLYGGWMPTLGKNRNVDAVFAAPHIGTGGPEEAADGYPVRCDALLMPRATTNGHGRRARVGILDTQLFPNDALDGRYTANGESLLTIGEASYSHYKGHATFVAGLVLEQAPNAELMVRAVLWGDDARTTTWKLATEMVDMADQGIDVLNLSLACQTEDGQPPLVLSRAVELLSPNMVIVAAAGNIDNDLVDGKKPIWPAALDDVIAVGADHEYGRAAAFSPTGPWVRLYAPGVDVTSTYLSGRVSMPKLDTDVSFDGWATWSGTSFAAATVSGRIAALIEPGQPARSGWEKLLRAMANRRDQSRIRLADYRVPIEEKASSCQTTART